MCTPSPDPDPEAIRRNLAHALPACIYSASPTLKLEFCNAQAVEVFGISLDDVAGHGWVDLIHPADRDSVLAAWEVSCATGQRYRHEHRLLVKGGQYGLPVANGHETSLSSNSRVPRTGDVPAGPEWYRSRRAS